MSALSSISWLLTIGLQFCFIPDCSRLQNYDSKLLKVYKHKSSRLTSSADGDRSCCKLPENHHKQVMVRKGHMFAISMTKLWHLVLNRIFPPFLSQFLFLSFVELHNLVLCLIANIWWLMMLSSSPRFLCCIFPHCTHLVLAFPIQYSLVWNCLCIYSHSQHGGTNSALPTAIQELEASV